MTEGRRVTANTSLTSGATNNFVVSDFTDTGGNSLTASDAVVVTSYLHENDATFRRTGDPDADSTFEINVDIESRTGAGERTEVTHIVNDVAGIEVKEDSSSAQDVTLIGVHLDASKIFVEQSNDLTNGSELKRTTGARGQEETIYELVMDSDANLIRRHDPDDDGTFEVDATVQSYTGSQVVRELYLPMKDESGRTNAEMETALSNDSGSANDYQIYGSIGISL